MEVSRSPRPTGTPASTSSNTTVAVPSDAMAESPRHDRGQQARLRLMFEGARVFAEKGYDAASTREICLAAQSNVAAIHYHFGDKAGLYRAILWASIERVVARFPSFDPNAHPQPPLEDALRALLSAFIEPMCQDDNSDPAAQWYARLHLRETLEPTPLMEDVIASGVVPHYKHVVALLAHHCRVKTPDDELHRLAFAIIAMAHDYCKSAHWMRVLSPGLIADNHAIEQTLTTLTGYACALVHFETQRRRAAQRTRAPRTPPPKRAKNPLTS